MKPRSLGAIRSSSSCAVSSSASAFLPVALRTISRCSGVSLMWTVLLPLAIGRLLKGVTSCLRYRLRLLLPPPHLPRRDPLFQLLRRQLERLGVLTGRLAHDLPLLRGELDVDRALAACHW